MEQIFQLRGWLKAGIFENGEIFPSDAGTPQGGVVSPLLANIALHGLEATLTTAFPKKHRVAVIRFADDFVILCKDLDTLQAARNLAGGHRVNTEIQQDVHHPHAS